SFEAETQNTIPSPKSLSPNEISENNSNKISSFNDIALFDFLTPVKEKRNESSLFSNHDSDSSHISNIDHSNQIDTFSSTSLSSKIAKNRDYSSSSKKSIVSRKPLAKLSSISINSTAGYKDYSTKFGTSISNSDSIINLPIPLLNGDLKSVEKKNPSPEVNNYVSNRLSNTSGYDTNIVDLSPEINPTTPEEKSTKSFEKKTFKNLLSFLDSPEASPELPSNKIINATSNPIQDLDLVSRTQSQDKSNTLFKNSTKTPSNQYINNYIECISSKNSTNRLSVTNKPIRTSFSSRRTSLRDSISLIPPSSRSNKIKSTLSNHKADVQNGSKNKDNLDNSNISQTTLSSSNLNYNNKLSSLDIAEKNKPILDKNGTLTNTPIDKIHKPISQNSDKIFLNTVKSSEYKKSYSHLLNKIDSSNFSNSDLKSTQPFLPIPTLSSNLKHNFTSLHISNSPRKSNSTPKSPFKSLNTKKNDVKSTPVKKTLAKSNPSKTPTKKTPTANRSIDKIKTQKTPTSILSKSKTTTTSGTSNVFFSKSPGILKTPTLNNASNYLGNSTSISNNASAEFTAQFIKSTIEDCLFQFKDEIKTDLQNIHLDTIKQSFSINNQLAKLNSLVKEKESLINRIEYLENENKRLREYDPFNNEWSRRKKKH
ncbi:hypothetical protein AYI70_g7760, partial [Smittium culicis]